MQRLFFSVKRVHWRWQKRALRMLRERKVPLTPARFALMRVLYIYKHGITRFNLAKLLGVAGSGVSRMLNALEDLGLVHRWKAESDGRVVMVKATDAGRAILDRALEATDTEVERIATVCFASSQCPDVDLEVLDRFLMRARIKLMDPTPFPVPWKGGELWEWENGWYPYQLDEPPPFKVYAA